MEIRSAVFKYCYLDTDGCEDFNRRSVGTRRQLKEEGGSPMEINGYCLLNYRISSLKLAIAYKHCNCKWLHETWY
jgi:hypothetical protein